MAAEPPHRRAHRADLAVLDVDDVGAGPHGLLQRRVPPRHARRRSTRGRSAGPRARCGRRSGRTSSPRIATVLADGTATWDEALQLFLERSGYREETYHTFSYSPLADDDGTTAGHLCVVAEVTEGVIGERRLATLRDLATEAAACDSERDLFAAVDRSLARNRLDLPFVLTYTFGPDGGIPPGTPTAGPSRRCSPGRGRWSSTSTTATTCPPAPGRNRRARRSRWRSPTPASRNPPASSSPASTRTARSTRPTAASSSCWPARSPPASRASAHGRPSAGARRRWPSWTARRPTSSPTSATSSARRCR